MIKRLSVSLLASMALVAVSALLLLMDDNPADAAFLSSGVGDPFVVNNLTVQSNATIGGTLTVTGGLTGNASTASALATNGANCAAGYYPLGINAAGAVESCTAIPEVTGLPTGTSGQTLRHNGTSWVGDSNLYNNGTNVGVGITGPTYKLHVNGSMYSPAIYVDTTGGSWLIGKTGTAGLIGRYPQTTSAYHPMLRQTTSSGHVINLGGLGDSFGFYGYDVNRTANGTDYSFTMNLANGALAASHNLSVGGALSVTGASTFSQPLTIGTPTVATHAATRSYVDSAVGSIAYATTAGSLSANGANCSAGYYPLGVDASGAVESCTVVPSVPSNNVTGSGTSAYLAKWNGTYTATNSIIYDNGTNIGIGTTAPTRKLQVTGDIYSSGVITASSYFYGNLAGQADYAAYLASNGSNCSAGYYARGIDSQGNAENCTAVPTGSDIYWTGTATNLVAATGRTSLGLGSLATLSAVTSAYITDATIVDADISASAAIASSKIANGTYFITSAGTSGQVWTSDGSGAGVWAAAASGISGSGSANYVPKWTGSTAQGNSQIYDNGTNVGIGTTAASQKLHVNGSVYATSFLYSSDASLKKNIVSLSGSLEKIKALQGVSFDWKSDGKHEIGFIAQDVEKVIPELVVTDTYTGLKSIKYGNIVPVLVEAIKEQQQQIDELRAEISALKK